MRHDELVLLLTTACNLRCPDCVFRIPHGHLGKPRMFSRAYFEEAAPFFQGLNLLQVSGGEPTLHPQFRELVPMIKEQFAPRILALATTGAKLLAYTDMVPLFEQVRIMQFDDDATRASIAWMREHYPQKLMTGRYYHHNIDAIGGGNPCHRKDIATYLEGRVWPCCSGPGMLGGMMQSVPLGPDWREQAAALPLPCDRCTFSEPCHT